MTKLKEKGKVSMTTRKLVLRGGTGGRNNWSALHGGAWEPMVCDEFIRTNFHVRRQSVIIVHFTVGRHKEAVRIAVRRHMHFDQQISQWRYTKDGDWGWLPIYSGLQELWGTFQGKLYVWVELL